jgi:hypothetical protein
MAKPDLYKKRLANATLAEAQAMDKAYADAHAKGLKEYTYKGLKYAVTGEPQNAAEAIVKARKPTTTPIKPIATTTPVVAKTVTKEEPVEKEIIVKPNPDKNSYIKGTNQYGMPVYNIDKNTPEEIAIKNTPVVKEKPTPYNKETYEQYIKRTGKIAVKPPVVPPTTPKPKLPELVPTKTTPSTVYTSPNKAPNPFEQKANAIIESTSKPKSYPSVAEQSKKFYEGMSQAQKEAQQNLQKLYPNSKVEVKQHEGKRDVATQLKYLKSGASRTELSMHNLGLAGDYGVYVDGKLSNKDDDYRVLGAAVKDKGNFWGWNWDKGHVGQTNTVANAMRKNPNIAKERVVQDFSKKYATGDVPQKYYPTLHVIDSLSGQPDRPVKYITGEGNVAKPDKLLEPLYVNAKKKYANGGFLPRFDLGGYNPPSLYGDEQEIGLSGYENFNTGQTAAGATRGRGLDIANRLTNAGKSIAVGAGDVNRRLKDPNDTTGTSGMAGMGLQAGAQAINMIDGMDGKPSTFGGIASGAMSGASMGAVGGLPGMAIGAVVGGGLALLASEKAKKDQAKADKLYMKNLNDQAEMGSQQTLRNYNTHGVTTSGAYAYGGSLPQYPNGGKTKTINLPHSVKNLATGEAGRTDDVLASVLADEPYDAISLGNDLRKGNYGDAAISAGALALPVVSAYAVKKALKYAPEVLNAAKQPLKKAMYALDSKAFRTAPNTYLKARDAVKGVSNAIDDKIIFPYQTHQLKKHVAKEIADLKHPEAIKRLEALGIDSDTPMIIPEVSYNKGERSWWNSSKGDSGQGRINMDLEQIKDLKKEGYDLTPKVVFDHELGHAMQGSIAKRYGWQGAIPTKLDYELRGIPVDVSKKYSSPKAEGSADYFFDTPTERMPHLREMRSEMLNKKIIKDKYQPITEKHIEKFAKKSKGNRILDFADLEHPDTKKNLAHWMNQLPAYAVPAAAGAGAYQYIKAKKPERTYAYGGVFPSYLTNSIARKGDSGLDYLDYPQRKMMQILTPEHYSATPSEYMNLRKWTDPNTTVGKTAGFAANVVADPLNLIPAAKLKYLKEAKEGINLSKVAGSGFRHIDDAYNGLRTMYNAAVGGTDLIKAASDYKDTGKKKLADGGTLDEFGNLVNQGVTKATRAVLPINAAMVAQDVTGNAMKKLTGDNFLTRGDKTPLTEKDLTPEELAVMRNTYNRATLRTGDDPGNKGKYYGVEYEDYGGSMEDVDPHNYQTLGHALIDPSHRLQTTIGGASIKKHKPNEDAVITDNFNFAGKNEARLINEMKHVNPLMNPYAGVYGSMGNIGSTTKAGIPIKINLGKMQEPVDYTGVTGEDIFRPKPLIKPKVMQAKKGYAWGGELPEYGKGGKIHIKKENRGKFTAYKKRTGKTTEEALHSKDPHVRQMANFARNAAKWHHKGRKKKHGFGGELDSYETKRYAYPYGGEMEPDYEVEGGEMIQGQQPMLEDGQQQQVASDLTKVPDSAPSHDEGGVSGAGGERVYSNRLKTANKKTYAKEAEELGKKKAKYESKIPNTNEAVSNTGHRMAERMDMKLDQLFNEQEMKKQLALPPSIYSSQPTMRYGGFLQRMWDGGTNPKFKPQTNINALPMLGGLYNSATNRRTAYGDYAGALAGLNTGQSRLYRQGDPNMPLNYQKLGVPILSTLARDKSGASTDYRYSGDDEFAPMQMRQSTLTAPNMAQNFKPVGPLPVPKIGGDEGGATSNAVKNGDGIPWQYVDNLASGIATANTPELAKPYYDPAVRMNTTYDINPQLQSARNARDASATNIRQNTVQGGAANSNMQQLYASSLDNANQLYAQKNNIENELKNKEILLNSGINSRNNDKRYAYDVENTKRRAGIQQDIVENARNFALDQYTSARDAKTDARDLESIKQIALANANSANYGYGLKAFADMYGADHAKLQADINRLAQDSPDSPALAYLRKMQAANKK